MKNSSWYLWLNGKKIGNIRELRDNFDTAALIGYFLGGSLHGWLSDIGENGILDRLSTIDTNGDIGRQLEFAFGVNPTKKDLTELAEPVIAQKISIPAKKAAAAGITEPVVYTGNVSSFRAASSFRMPGAVFSGDTASSGYGAGSYTALLTGQALSSSGGLYGSFRKRLNSSYTFGAGGSGITGLLGSLNLYTLFGYGGSYSFGSMLSGGSYLSFLNTPGLLGSFAGYGSYKGLFVGSFAWGTFTLGSYSYNIVGSYGNLGSFGNFGRLWQTGSFGSFGSFGGIDRFFAENGSYRSSVTGAVITAEEYRRTLINLSSCPLNAYGYGIDLI